MMVDIDADKNVDHNAPLPQVIARENKGAGIGEMFHTFLAEVAAVHVRPSARL